MSKSLALTAAEANSISELSQYETKATELLEKVYEDIRRKASNGQNELILRGDIWILTFNTNEYTLAKRKLEEKGYDLLESYREFSDNFSNGPPISERCVTISW